MTVKQLYRRLETIIDAGHGRKHVCVNKQTFTHPLESDGACILEISAIEIQTFEMLDDDGWLKELADGSIGMRTCAVITGGSEAPDAK